MANTPKIINGTNVTLPYQALLSTNPMDLSGSYHGGGVLITPRCIVTAKHVITGGGSNLKAYVGINNRSQATQPLTVSKNVVNADGDIGLIFLTNDVPNVNNVNPSIKLASEDNSTW